VARAGVCVGRDGFLGAGGSRGGARRGAGERPVEALPLDDLAVRILRMEIVALQRIAVRDGRSVEAGLARELRDLVSAQSSWLCREIPRFAAELNWP
jgi:hypothetical protein